MALKSVSKADPNFVPNYQLAAIPFVTSSNIDEVKDSETTAIHFPFVTKCLKINNSGAEPLKVGFTDAGVTAGIGTAEANFFIIPTAAAGDVCIQEFDVRCKSIFFRSTQNTTDFSLFAGLTPVGSGSFPVLSEENGFNGVGSGG